MSAYYNEFDKHAAAWLRRLIAEGLIAPGEVDDRPIQDVRADDLQGYEQCHFFAGIGGWSYALRLAGVADDAVVWTGSCPCQPFSSAGKRKGFADERHLWPEFFRLVAERRPAIASGEQVAGKPGLEWLAGVFADLETVGYACAAADLPAACVGAPHKRQRLFWVANSGGTRLEGRKEQSARHQCEAAERSGDACPVGNCNRQRCNGKRVRLLKREPQQAGAETTWASEVVRCEDGNSRRIPIEPAFFPLANGIPARVVRLRGYGNAIVPQVAAEFVRAALAASGAKAE